MTICFGFSKSQEQAAVLHNLIIQNHDHIRGCECDAKVIKISQSELSSWNKLTTSFLVENFDAIYTAATPRKAERLVTLPTQDEWAGWPDGTTHCNVKDSVTCTYIQISRLEGSSLPVTLACLLQYIDTWGEVMFTKECPSALVSCDTTMKQRNHINNKIDKRRDATETDTINIRIG
jgi:hypothetical protein